MVDAVARPKNPWLNSALEHDEEGPTLALLNHFLGCQLTRSQQRKALDLGAPMARGRGGFLVSIPSELQRWCRDNQAEIRDVLQEGAAKLEHDPQTPEPGAVETQPGPEQVLADTQAYPQPPAPSKEIPVSNRKWCGFGELKKLFYHLCILAMTDPNGGDNADADLLSLVISHGIGYAGNLALSKMTDEEREQRILFLRQAFPDIPSDFDPSNRMHAAVLEGAYDLGLPITSAITTVKEWQRAAEFAAKFKQQFDADATVLMPTFLVLKAREGIGARRNTDLTVRRFRVLSAVLSLFGKDNHKVEDAFVSEITARAMGFKNPSCMREMGRKPSYEPWEVIWDREYLAGVAQQKLRLETPLFRWTTPNHYYTYYGSGLMSRGEFVKLVAPKERGVRAATRRKDEQNRLKQELEALIARQPNAAENSEAQPTSSPAEGSVESDGSPNEFEQSESQNEAHNGKRNTAMQSAREVLIYLNTKAGRNYQPIDTNLKPIACRLEEVELDTEGVKKMVDRQCARWKGDDKMDEYLRVSTLFNKTKFHEYYAARDLPVAPRRQQPNHEGGF